MREAIRALQKINVATVTRKIIEHRRNKQTWRVFCIGFNKTGTTSLHRLFESQGLKSAHNTHWPHTSHVIGGERFFNYADCYSDGERASFTQLIEWFPDSVFILNTRNERDWLHSRIKHVFRNESSNKKGAELKWMARDFLTDPELCIDYWIRARRIYQAQARAKLSRSNRFLEVSVTDQTDWSERVLDILISCNIIHEKRPFEEIHKNRRDAYSFEPLKNLLKLADERLIAAGSEETKDANEVLAFFGHPPLSEHYKMHDN